MDLHYSGMRVTLASRLLCTSVRLNWDDSYLHFIYDFKMSRSCQQGTANTALFPARTCKCCHLNSIISFVTILPVWAGLVGSLHSIRVGRIKEVRTLKPKSAESEIQFMKNFQRTVPAERQGHRCLPFSCHFRIQIERLLRLTEPIAVVVVSSFLSL